MQSDKRSSSEQVDEFYVGYLPMPAKLKRRVLLIVGVAGCLFICLGVLISISMRDAGRGRWDDARLLELSGRLVSQPYPSLVVNEPRGSAARRLLLVEEGKMGARSGLSKLDGMFVSVRGHLIHRDDCELIELLASDDAVVASGSPAGPKLANAEVTRKSVVLRGEIIDPKCFAGAMKPGDGKTHKACAALCLRGGVPPRFAVWNEQGQVTTHLLANKHGQSFAGEELERVIGFVGDWVEVEGELETQESHTVFRINLDTMMRR